MSLLKTEEGPQGGGLLEVTTTRLVPCRTCSGTGWVSVYHNDTKECYNCGGAGEVMSVVPITFEELLSKVNCAGGGGYLEPSDIIVLNDVYARWREAS